MNQESNFYRVYQLAYSDRTQSLKSLILVAILLSLFSIASLLFLGGLNTANYQLLIVSGILWFLGFSLLPLFYLVAPKSQIFLSPFIFGAAFFAPLLALQNYNLILLYIYLSVLVLLFISVFRLKGEADTLINLNLARLISKVSFLFTLIIFIIIGTLIYYDYTNISFINSSTHIETIANNYLSKFSPDNNIKLDDSIDNLLARYINQQIPTSSLANKSMNQLLLIQTRTTLSQMLNVPLTGKETLWEVIKKYFTSHWENFSLLVKIGVGFLIVSSIFSLISLCSSVFNFIFTILSYTLLKILVAIKYIKIKMVGVEKEELSLV